MLGLAIVLVSLFRLGFALLFLVLRGVELRVVSFAAVFRDVTQRSPERNVA